MCKNTNDGVIFHAALKTRCSLATCKVKIKHKKNGKRGTGHQDKNFTWEKNYGSFAF